MLGKNLSRLSSIFTSVIFITVLTTHNVSPAAADRIAQRAMNDAAEAFDRAQNARDIANRAIAAAAGAEARVNDAADDAVRGAVHAARAQLNVQVEAARAQAQAARDRAAEAAEQARDAAIARVHAQAERNADHAQHQQAIEGAEARLRQIFRDEAIHNAEAGERAAARIREENQEKMHAAELQLHARKLELDLEKDLKFARENAPIQIDIKKGEIEAKKAAGIYDLEAKTAVDIGKYATDQKWAAISKMFESAGDGIKNLTNDPKRMAKIVAAIAATAIAIYGVKHGMPILMSYLVQPKVVSETSRQSWFGSTPPQQDVNINNLTFSPALQAQLNDLAKQVTTAKLFDENLPNVMFWGAPGTGKTAFARALAYASGLDYALTSGSEFAKITDLNLANNELRKLLRWAQTSDKGLIIFIDEAESLFANRKLATTSKGVQDFINTFLALVPEKSQKNVMFIFATNHPFKLDDAIVNRVGTSIEFTLPEQPEREQILSMYLDILSRKNKAAPVELTAEIRFNVPQYAQSLQGLAPRAIKFVAEQMVIRARREKDAKLTHAIAHSALAEAKSSHEQSVKWQAEREAWVKAQTNAAAAA